MPDHMKQRDLLLFYAELYKPPGDAVYEVISHPDFRTELEQASGAALNDCCDLPSLSSLKEEFRSLFSSSSQNGISLIESFYKPWTTDQTAALPFAQSKGMMMGDPAWHMRYLLEEIGLNSSYDPMFYPDHISVILELAAFLLEEQETDKFTLLVSQHLNWLDDLVEAIRKQKKDSLYLKLTELLNKFVNEFTICNQSFDRLKEDSVC
ncbi:molecular chaperone TorD family protein [Salipaludibacillus sp. CUR1]|uniref:TorD/DmsD family molecular chaperone n=1 Tax=Salipaludibacillus sp. CUR1 TaxID=2820003 RepID=UPI001E566294|nr:molecular chaperone TorD family protein [Salipaludibacillus sp. CUR1]MCE7790856.1 molecular chaperone TorD family protein [Salipaludibacillus sp. CUR1]